MMVMEPWHSQLNSTGIKPYKIQRRVNDRLAELRCIFLCGNLEILTGPGFEWSCGQAQNEVQFLILSWGSIFDFELNLTLKVKDQSPKQKWF